MLRKFLGSEEFAEAQAPTNTIDLDAAIIQDQTQEEETRTQNSVYALSEINSLQEANDTWTKIFKSARKTDRVTPEVFAGVEAHFKRLADQLGRAFETEQSAMESVGDDTELYLMEATSSLESVSGTLGKLKNAVLDSISKAWHDKADSREQIKVLTALNRLAKEEQKRLAIKYKTKTEKVTINTGRYTNTFTVQGKVNTQSPFAVVKVYFDSIHDLTDNYAMNVFTNLDKLVVLAGKIIKTSDLEAKTDLFHTVTKIPTPSELVPVYLEEGKHMLGNLALDPNKHNKIRLEDEAYGEYFHRRATYGRPTWVAAGKRAEATDLTMDVGSLILICKLIEIDTANLIKWLPGVDKAHRQLEAKIRSVKIADLPDQATKVMVTHLFNAVTSELVNGINPVQELMSKHLPILRGLLGFISKA